MLNEIIFGIMGFVFGCMVQRIYDQENLKIRMKLDYGYLVNISIAFITSIIVGALTGFYSCSLSAGIIVVVMTYWLILIYIEIRRLNNA